MAFSSIRAHQLSTLLGSILVGACMWVVIRRWPPASRREALAIGLLWVALTITFECFMGLVLLQRSLAQVLADYNVCAGRVWVFFLLWLAVAPWLFFRLRAAAKPWVSTERPRRPSRIWIPAARFRAVASPDYALVSRF